ncbi:MAG: M48 family metalloprotease [Burkholderiales bacterium]|jgi:putative metalloprotease|nr:M48 family metalloprotease [Burkholderiales bacterium]
MESRIRKFSLFFTGGKALSALSVLLLFTFLNIEEGRANLFDKIGAATDVVKAATVSDDELKEVSKQMMAHMDEKNRVAPANDKYAKRLAGLVKNHTNEDGISLNYKVYLTRDVNAFATPDGSIRFFSGLMDIMTDDELLFIIGHEIAHVKLEHRLKAIRTAYMASAAAKAASASGKLNAQHLTEIAEKFVNAQFSQSQEYDADSYGVAFMQRHKYNVSGAEGSMRKIADLDGTAAGGKGSIFGTHPGSKERADRIRNLSKS